MATYKQLQDWVKEQYGFVPHKCWIADVKRMEGLRMRKAPNRIGDTPVILCPNDKIEPIRSALAYFRMIK